MADFVSADDLDQRRKMAQQLMAQGTSAAPVQHWTQGLARVLQGGVGGMWQGSAREGEQQNRDATMGALSANPQFGSLSPQERGMLANNPALMNQVAGQIYGQRFDPMADLKKQQMQGQLQLQKGQMQLQQTQLQDIKRQSPEWREQNAQRFGLQPGTPEHNQFVISGQYAAPPKPQFVHYPEGQQAGVFDGGKFTPVDAGAGNVTEQRRAKLQEFGVSPDSHAGKAYLANGKLPATNPMTAADKEQIYKSDDQVEAAANAIGNLQQALKESAKAFTGPTAGARGYITSVFGNEGGIATETLDNLVTSNAVQSLKTVFGGNPTEGERKVLIDLAGSANKAQPVRDGIYRRAIALAEKRQQFYQQRAGQLRGGDFYKPQGAPAAQPGGWKIERVD